MTGDQARAFAAKSMAGKRIVFFDLAAAADAQKNWNHSFERIFTRLGATYVHLDANFDVNLMSQQMDAQIAKGADAFLILPPDPGAISAQVKAAQAKGIYVVAMSQLPNATPDAFVGPDFQGGANELAKRVVTDCKAKGKDQVAVLDSFGTDTLSTAFNKGWADPFKAGGIKVVAHQQTKFDPAIAGQVAATVLQTSPDLCAMMVNWDQTAVAVAQAVKVAGKAGSVGVYNMDGSASWCDAVRKGSAITAGVTIDFPAIAVNAATLVQNLIESGRPAGSNRTIAYLPDAIVDKTNVGQISGSCYTAQG